MTKLAAIATPLTAFESTDLLSAHPTIERAAQIGFDPEQLMPTRTYLDIGIEKLIALCDAMGMNAKTAQIVEIFRLMSTGWGDRTVGDKVDWQSNVSDDCAPFEFSIVLDAQQSELRVLVEAQGSAPNLQSNWAAGLQLNQELAERFNISLDRFEQIADLYVPTDPDAKFAMWHAVCFYPDQDPAFKLYLNPQAQSRSRATAVVEASLVRLGFSRAWLGLAEIAAQRGPDRDGFPYFSIDLAAGERARVKIYLRHYDATAADLERALSLAQNYLAGTATEFCQALTESQGVFTSKPIVSCFAFTEGNEDRPTAGTLYIPIGYYAPNDRLVADRLSQYFSQYNLPTSTYTKAIEAFALRPLDQGIGMHSHIALKREQQQPRVTIYLNPEVHTVRSIEPQLPEIASGQSQTALEATAWRYETDSIAEHPFLQRLQREPVNLTHLWLLFVNGREGIVANFTRRLASVVGRIDDEQIRCILTKQLNEELGNGDVSKVHRLLFDRLILALEPYKPQVECAAMLAPGRELSQQLETLYADPNAYVGVGAAIVMEIRGKQIDAVMGTEFVTRTTLDRSALLWLHIHEELEVGHAEEAQELACIIAADGDADAARQGAQRTADALWTFFNGMYRVCFGDDTNAKA